MKVWKINLLDNRSCKSSDRLEKFDFCKEKGIVGIGWAGYEEKELPEDDKDLKAFKTAKSKLEEFEIGDFVWVKVPNVFEVWLCVVKSTMIKTDDPDFNDKDIGYYCECEYICLFTPQKLPKTLQYENLITRSAVSEAAKQVNDATFKIYQAKTKKKKSAKEMFVGFLNNVKKYWYIYATALLLLIITTVTISILNASKAAKVKDYIEGKTFISQDFVYKDYEAYSFKDGKIAEERVLSYLNYKDDDGKVYGDITNFSNKYKVEASVFSDKIWILTQHPHGYSRTVAVYLEDGVVKKYKHTIDTPEWEETTLEQINTLRINTICNHKYSEWNIINEATITIKGKKERACSKCGMVEKYEYTYASMLKPSIKQLEERILQANNDLEMKKTQSGSSTIYSVYNPKFILTVPSENSDFALALEQYLGDGYNFMLSTSTSSNGNISWICAQGNFEFGDYLYRNTIIPYVFGEKYMGNDPLNLDSVMDFANKSDKSIENGWNIYEYKFGEITYKLKQNKTGFYFYIYF